MEEKAQILVTKFIEQKFNIKRIKDDKKKWMRCIIVPSGYVRKQTKIYPINRSTLNHEYISSDITKTICYVFGFNQKDVEPLVNQYIKTIKI